MVSKTCYDFYSSAEKYKVPLNLPRWEHLPENTSWSDALNLCPEPWRYTSSEELGTLPLVGFHEVYNGGGYVAQLGYNARSAKRVLNELFPNTWIDRQTRAVILEFVIFNTNLNMSTVVSLLYELLPTGGFTRYEKTESLSLFPSEYRANGLLQTMRLVFYLMALGYLIYEVKKCFHQRLKYFKQLWNWLNLLIVFLSILIAIFELTRQKASGRLVSELQINPFATVSFHRVLYYLDAENTVVSLLLFLATLKMMKLIKFNSHIILLAWMLKVSKNYLISFSVHFIILQLAFVCAGMLIFTGSSDKYVSVPRGIVSQMEYLLGHAMPLDELPSQIMTLGKTYALVYMSSMTMVFVNFFVVILNESLQSAREKTDEIRQENEEADFIKAQTLLSLKDMFGMRKRETRLFCDDAGEWSIVTGKWNEVESKIGVLYEDITLLGYTRHQET